MTRATNPMNTPDTGGRSRLARLRSVAVALICLSSLALPAVARAGSGRSHSSARGAVLPFSRCMRSHGVPRFPNPTASGVIPRVSPHALGVSSSEYRAAQNACASQAKLAYAFIVARCLHEHPKAATAQQTCQEYGKQALGDLP